MLETLREAVKHWGGERVLRELLARCRRLVSERGDANMVAIARELVARIEALPKDLHLAFFAGLALDFNPDPKAVLAHAQAYRDAPHADHLVALSAVVEPPRQELMRRINSAHGGTAAIVRMRHALLEHLPRQPQLRALEADMLHLLTSWFSPGFLQLRRVDWNSPAQLLEQIIRHEAVHAIDGWDDLRRRLQPDRRCFAFFHPQLRDEPLIFVEVALLAEMPSAIAPLIVKDAAPQPKTGFKVAAFYSISNCQPGLRGVSLGNFLIKRVAEELKRELPQLRTFCTLSPVPGFAAWLATNPDFATLPGLKRGAAATLERARHLLCGDGASTGPTALAALADAARLQELDAARQQALLHLCASYLVYLAPNGGGGDPVARFHLDNGARLERLNWLGDLSRKGAKQSFGLMVNYLYDLTKVEAYHEKFSQGEAAHSRAVAALL